LTRALVCWRGMVRFRLRFRLLWTIAALLTAAGCGFDPTGDRPFDPPPVYREWWTKTEACSGLSGNFDRVRWVLIEGRSFSCSSGQCAGHWSSFSHQIFLASDWAANEMVVRHEMLHDLIGHPGHPDPPFGKGCPLTWATWDGGASGLDVAGTPSSPSDSGRAPPKKID
jgi:hypothetical protein